MAWPKGKPQTSEHIAKRSAALKGYKQTPEHIANHSKAAFIKENTPEILALIQRHGYPLVHCLRTKYHGLNKRCSPNNSLDYDNYYGRGIRNLFTSMYAFFIYAINEMHIITIEQIQSLDIHRTNNDGSYEPGNIEFLTPAEHRARHRSKPVTF